MKKRNVIKMVMNNGLLTLFTILLTLFAFGCQRDAVDTSVISENMMVEIIGESDVDGGRTITIQLENRTPYQIYCGEVYISYPLLIQNGKKLNSLMVKASGMPICLKKTEEVKVTAYLPEIFRPESVDDESIQIMLSGYADDVKEESHFEWSFEYGRDEGTYPIEP